MKIIKAITFLSVCSLVLSSCKDKNEPVATSPKLILKFRFDSTQFRTGNFGETQSVPDSNAAQSPKFNHMGASFVELTANDNVLPFQGTQVAMTPSISGATDFTQLMLAGNNEVFLTTDLSSIANGTYPYIRISLAYQNYEIKFNYQNNDYTGTLASFIGEKTYVNNYTIKDENVQIDTVVNQGYWGFEPHIPTANLFFGQSPVGATTVPNPLNDTSPIEISSCLVTGQFDSPLEITGNETEDIVIICSISTNNSFEWRDNNDNDKFEPETETVVDMGVRGLIPIIE